MKLSASRSFRSAAELDYGNHPDDQVELAEDGKPLDYVDEKGIQWVMAACGHRVGGGVQPGERSAMCPNCMFLIKFRSVPVVYPERLPNKGGDTSEDLESGPGGR